MRVLLLALAALTFAGCLQPSDQAAEPPAGDAVQPADEAAGPRGGEDVHERASTDGLDASGERADDGTADGGWPREGSVVAYAARTVRAAPDGTYRQVDEAAATWTFRDGGWGGSCRRTTQEFVEGRGWSNATATVSLQGQPPTGPRDPPAMGAPVEAEILDGCDVERREARFVGEDTESVAGERARTYAAVVAGSSHEFRSEWSQDRGIVVTWSGWRSSGALTTSFDGRLTRADAPL